ncbi:Fc.00g000080.m01.CDS01 [Cosmosporella sp. VM-42]
MRNRDRNIEEKATRYTDMHFDGPHRTSVGPDQQRHRIRGGSRHAETVGLGTAAGGHQSSKIKKPKTSHVGHFNFTKDSTFNLLKKIEEQIARLANAGFKWTEWKWGDPNTGEVGRSWKPHQQEDQMQVVHEGKAVRRTMSLYKVKDTSDNQVALGQYQLSGFSFNWTLSWEI